MRHLLSYKQGGAGLSVCFSNVVSSLWAHRLLPTVNLAANIYAENDDIQQQQLKSQWEV